MQSKLQDVELSIRGILRGFGLKVGEVSKGRFTVRIRELIGGQPMLERVIEPMLRARETLRAEFHTLHRAMLGIVRADGTCRRLMTVPAPARQTRPWCRRQAALCRCRVEHG